MEGGGNKVVVVVVVLMLLVLSTTAAFFHGAAARLQGGGAGGGGHGHRGRVAESVPTASRKTAGHSDCSYDSARGKTGHCPPK